MRKMAITLTSITEHAGSLGTATGGVISSGGRW